jgi:hypothetical protein
MKTVLLTSFGAFALVIGAGEDPSINGQWQVHSSVSGNESDMLCTFIPKRRRFERALHHRQREVSN